MPAKKFIEDFQYDPATFDPERFKAAIIAELDGDEALTTAKIDSLTQQNGTLTESERDLKIRLFDATIANKGPAVNPTDSPANGAGGTPPVPPVTNADIFGSIKE